MLHKIWFKCNESRIYQMFTSEITNQNHNIQIFGDVCTSMSSRENIPS